MIATTVSWPQSLKWDPETVVDAHIDSRRLDDGRVDHTLTLETHRRGLPLWSKAITFKVDAPFSVKGLNTADPFVVAALFPAMEVGGTLRVHGPVSRTLMRNLVDLEGVWVRAAPRTFRPFQIEAEVIDDDTEQRPSRSHPKTILAFTGGLSSTLALYRNKSGDAGLVGHDIGATVLITGMDGRGEADGATEARIGDLREASAACGVPMALVDTDIAAVLGGGRVALGSWLGSCLQLFAGSFDVALLGSSVTWYAPGYEIYRSHPLLDPLMSGGEMSIRNDEGMFDQVDKAALLSRYPDALGRLHVCPSPPRPNRNCCRCEKCVRAMLCFDACGQPIPAVFHDGLGLSEISVALRCGEGLHRSADILASARRYGTQDVKSMRELRRKFRTETLKRAAKPRLGRLASGDAPSRWYILDGV